MRAAASEAAMKATRRLLNIASDRGPIAKAPLAKTIQMGPRNATLDDSREVQDRHAACGPLSARGRVRGRAFGSPSGGLGTLCARVAEAERRMVALATPSVVTH